MTKNTQENVGISSVQKIITLGMLVFMGYLFFAQEKLHKEQQPKLPASVEAVMSKIPEPVKVKIIDTDSGAISFSDLRKGKVLIGKWEVELDEPKVEPKTEAKLPEKLSKETK
jgi:hypothetical protein